MSKLNMSYDHLLNQLQSLKSVEPDTDFLARSRQLILSSKPKPAYIFQIKNAFAYTSKLSLALGLMVLLLLTLSGRLTPSSSLIASLNNKQLVREGAAAQLDIKLAEAKYYKEVNNKINLALNEIIGQPYVNP